MEFELSASPPTWRVVISNSRDLPNAGCFLHESDRQCRTADTGRRRFTRASASTSLACAGESSAGRAQCYSFVSSYRSPYGLENTRSVWYPLPAAKAEVKATYTSSWEKCAVKKNAGTC